MKKTKFLLIIISLFMLIGCIKSDALLFKEEYESLNGSTNIRSVSISDDNPFIYITEADLIEEIKNKNDIVVYFGFSDCPWCRSIIENLIQVSADLGIKEIYYLDIKDIRDVKTIDADDNIQTEKEGSAGYLEMVSLLNDYLADYVIDEVVVGKRIYAPNILVIKNGEIQGIETGISDFQTDAMEELTEEIQMDSYQKIYTLLSKYKNNTCSSDEKAC